MAEKTAPTRKVLFSKADLAHLAKKGISNAEAARQLELLVSATRYLPISRPCTVSDGISTISASDHNRLLELYDSAAAAGRCMKFVPASGAASRMFRDLLGFLDVQPLTTFENLRLTHETKQLNSLFTFLDHIADFAFCNQLLELLQGQGLNRHQILVGTNYLKLLRTLLLPEGLNYSQLPKALLLFHRYGDVQVRTSLEEHFVEAALTVKDSHTKCRIHLTVSPEHLTNFKSFLAQHLEKYDKQLHCHIDVSLSVQKSSTETLAVGLDGKPFHDQEGELLLRPGGHGALIENLNELSGDIVFIKNIDNVQRDPAKQGLMIYKRLLGGKLVDLQQNVFVHLRRMRSELCSKEQVQECVEFAQKELCIGMPSTITKWQDRRLYLAEKLNRPLRVCGVVKNTGEPGGGPFWVNNAQGAVSTQIVEEAQVNREVASQLTIFASSTHFNPVDLVCGVRDAQGNLFDLPRFIDQNAVIKVHKSYNGRDLISCERPGLWNGAMSDWTTIFVEVPAETFTPVKTVHDLLRPAHKIP